MRNNDSCSSKKSLWKSRDKINKCIKLGGFVNTDNDFKDHAL